MKHKTKSRGFDDEECCYSKALSANPRKIGPKCSRPRLKASLSQLVDSTDSNKWREKGSVATARLSSSSMAENFSQRGHETRTYLCACHLGFYSAKFINICKKWNYNHSFKKFCRKLLTYHQEISMQTLVVTSSFKRNAKTCQNSSPPTSAHH